MVSSITSSPAVDLSALPAPVIIDQPGFEARDAAKLARLISLIPDFTALVESDPAIKLLESDSYDEVVQVQAFVDAAKSNLLAFATGPTLDHLAVLFGVARLELTPANDQTGDPAILETDTDLRSRVLIAPHSFSVAGPELAYVYHARSASADVLDASATSPNPGEVLVSILSREGDGTAPAQTINAVDAVLQNDAVRPLTDMVTVQSAEIVDFNITADLWLYAGPDSNLVETTALAALDDYLSANRRLGRDITRAGIIAALKVPNVQNVILTAPDVDLVLTPLHAGHVDQIAITLAGTTE